MLLDWKQLRSVAPFWAKSNESFISKLRMQLRWWAAMGCDGPSSVDEVGAGAAANEKQGRASDKCKRNEDSSPSIKPTTV